MVRVGYLNWDPGWLCRVVLHTKSYAKVIVLYYISNINVEIFFILMCMYMKFKFIDIWIFFNLWPIFANFSTMSDVDISFLFEVDVLKFLLLWIVAVSGRYQVWKIPLRYSIFFNLIVEVCNEALVLTNCKFLINRIEVTPVCPGSGWDFDH